MLSINRSFLLFGSGLLLIMLMSSCVGLDQLVNFNQSKPISDEVFDVPPPPEFQVQTDDILQIQVSSSNMQLAAPYNPFMPSDGRMAGGGGMSGGDETGPMSYLVSKDGTIYFPRFGQVEVGGLSTTEITDKLTEMLKPAISDAVVKVRILNFRVTVTGEVRNPGPVSVPEESLTILEAIGMSGDFTEFSNRENVLVVREVDGKRTFKRLNVLTTEVFDSPYYYLQQGDLVYVEPLEQKSGILSNEARATFSIVGGVSSVVSLVVTILAVTGTI